MNMASDVPMFRSKCFTFVHMFYTLLLYYSDLSHRHSLTASYSSQIVVKVTLGCGCVGLPPNNDFMEFRAHIMFFICGHSFETFRFD